MGKNGKQKRSRNESSALIIFQKRKYIVHVDKDEKKYLTYTLRKEMLASDYKSKSISIAICPEDYKPFLFRHITLQLMIFSNCALSPHAHI